MTVPSHINLTDKELLQLFYADHNNEWLGVLLERYTLLLYGVSMKYLKNPEEAKDAVQQIFLKAIPELHKYEVTYFSSWLYMIARNYCLMKLRDKKNPSRPVDRMEDLPATAEEPDFLIRENMLQQLETALNALSGEQKLCINLFYLQKKSYQEIAAETGYSLLQVKSYIQNGKRNLRLLIEKRTGK
ncbi:MAG TPA: sigma-70 family RNA polymerase sigma factor [Puia sp.]